MYKIFKFSFILFLLIKQVVYADVVKEIIISGNDRISKETIKIFSNVKTGNNIDEEKINLIIKDLYETNFFENIIVNFNKNKLLINVVELPIIENIFIEGLTAKKNLKMINDNLKIRAKSSFSNDLLKNEIKSLKNILRQKGYYFAEINTYIENLQDNKINLRFDIDIGEKTKIKKISFVGPKIFKESKLKSIIISEENNFWKFLSQKNILMKI